MAGQGPDQQRLVLCHSLPVHQSIAARASAPHCGHHTRHCQVCGPESSCNSMHALSSCEGMSGIWLSR